MAMKVVLINRSDTVGGAAVVTVRLMNALRAVGIDARMIVTDRRGNDPHTALAGSNVERKAAFYAERLGIYARNGFNRDTLFQIDTADCGINLASHPWVREADVVALNWVNQGTLSMKGIERIGAMGKPIVWTMHDMWNCTGVCHHAYGCPHFTATCHSCPLTGSKGSDLSTGTQNRKRALYASTPIHFVAVSHWLEGRCRASSLMADAQISVIPNAFPSADFDWQQRSDADVATVAADATVVVMGAARLDDPVKGFDLLIDATKLLADRNSDLASRMHLVLYGSIRNQQLLNELAIPHTFLGYRSDVNRIMQNAHVVLSTSRYETLPGTLVEGMASGCTPVTTGDGGQPDIVDHLRTGYVTRSTTAQEIATGLEWAATHRLDREAQHRAAAEKFDSAVVAQSYIKLFNDLLAK